MIRSGYRWLRLEMGPSEEGRAIQAEQFSARQPRFLRWRNDIPDKRKAETKNYKHYMRAISDPRKGLS